MDRKREGSRGARIPLVIGVTGHRNLRQEDLAPLESAVRAVLTGYQRRLSSTPLLILSALAEGADQLVARVGLECGADLAVVLPMPRRLYRSLLTEQAQRGFDVMLAQAHIETELPIPEGVTESDLTESAEVRGGRLAALRDFLTTYSHALIALWDGVENGKRGGTGDVVRHYLQGCSAPLAIDALPNLGRLHHILTPRLSNPAPHGIPFQATILTHENEDEKGANSDLATQEQGLDLFNRDASEPRREAPPSFGGLLPDADATVVSTFDTLVAQWYWSADAASVNYNTKTKKALVRLLWFAFIAFAGFEVYAHVLSHNPALWLAYPLALSVGWIIHHRARSGNIETKYLDYRALAEALRVQFFWSIAGVRNSVVHHYLRHYQTEVDWIRAALRTVSLYLTAAPHPLDTAKKGIDLAVRYWVEDQAGYYSRSATKQRTTLERLDHRSEKMLCVVWLLSILIPLSLLIPVPWLRGWQALMARELYRGILLLSVPIPSVLIGLFRVFVEHAGYSEHARMYSRMARVFNRVATLLRQQLRDGNLEHCQATLRRLGIDALEENGDWLVLHRERPLKVVSGA